MQKIKISAGPRLTSGGQARLANRLSLVARRDLQPEKFTSCVTLLKNSFVLGAKSCIISIKYPVPAAGRGQQERVGLCFQRNCL